MKQSGSQISKPFKIAFYVFGLIIFQEIIFRFCFPLPEIQNLNRINFKLTQSDTRVYAYSRNVGWYWESILDTATTFEHNMNFYGFRDKEWVVEKPQGVQRVIFIGDSFVEGIMAEQDQSIPVQFQHEAGNQKFEVFNAGMLGVGLSEYLQLFADIVPLYKPDVVFFCIYANDLGKSKTVIPELYLEPEYFNPFTPRLWELIRQAKNYGPVLFRWHNRRLPFFSAVPNPSNPWTHKESELASHVAPHIAEAMKSGHFNPFRTNSFIKEEQYLKSPPQLGETLSFFNFFCEKFEVEPVVVYLPSRNQLTKYYYSFEKEMCLVNFRDSIDLTTPEYQLHQEVIANQCKALNIQFIDLTPFIKEKETNNQHLFWNYDEHMKAAGYKLAGQTIWDEWNRNK